MATIKEEKYPIRNNRFEYLGNHYDCQLAIESDIKMILREAEATHKDSFDTLYDKDTLKPSFIRIFVDANNVPIYGMIIYSISYRIGSNSRSACGNYYPVKDFYLQPHPFQASICW